MASEVNNPVTIPVGLELTFIPDKRGKWKEYRVKREAEEVAARFNALLECIFTSKSLRQKGRVSTTSPFRAKADVFRSKHSVDPIQPHSSWCIEIASQPLEIDDWVSSIATETSSSGRAGRASARKPNLSEIDTSIAAVYLAAQALGLYPHIEATNSKTGKTTDYPTGGGHIHTSIAGFFPYGDSFLQKMSILEQMLCLDYANNPWIRWLFAQWSDDSNSQIAIRRSDLVDMACKKNRIITPEQWKGAIHSITLSCHAIRARFAATGKPVYPTYEWRFFDMPRNPEELRLQLVFLFAWIKKRIVQVNALFSAATDPKLFDDIYDFYRSTILRVLIDVSHFDNLVRSPFFARAVARCQMLEFGLKTEEIDAIFAAFWERNYLRRMRFGKPI